MAKDEEDKVWKIWNYMEHTYDCLRCGSRWDFQADVAYEKKKRS